jgi:hypothetical protein
VLLHQIGGIQLTAFGQVFAEYRYELFFVQAQAVMRVFSRRVRQPLSQSTRSLLRPDWGR